VVENPVVQNGDVGGTDTESETQNPPETPANDNDQQTPVATPNVSEDADTDDELPQVTLPEVVVQPVDDVPPPGSIQTPTPTPAPVADPKPAPTKTDEAVEFTDLLNDYRIANDVGRVTLADELSDEARINNLGDTPHNYMGQSQVQNWARGYTSVSAVLQGWIDSPGHNANLLHPAVKTIGLSHDGTEWTFNGSFRNVTPATNPPPADPAVVAPVVNPIDVETEKEAVPTESSPPTPKKIVLEQPFAEPQPTDPGQKPDPDQRKDQSPILTVVPPAAEPTKDASDTEYTRSRRIRGLRRLLLAKRFSSFVRAPASEPTTPVPAPQRPPAAKIPMVIGPIKIPPPAPAVGVVVEIEPALRPEASALGSKGLISETEPTILRNEKFDYDDDQDGPATVPVGLPSTQTPLPRSGSEGTRVTVRDDSASSTAPAATVPLKTEPTALAAGNESIAESTLGPEASAFGSDDASPVSQSIVIHSPSPMRGLRRLFLASSARVHALDQSLGSKLTGAPGNPAVKAKDAVFNSTASPKLTDGASRLDDEVLDLIADPSPWIGQFAFARALASRAA
jgi:uncharacterized protein YkwD